MTKTKTRFLTVGLAVIVLLAAALFVIPALGTTANAEAWDGTIAKEFAGGTGTETDPYQIANGEQLAYLAHQVNEGESSSGEYFKLTADIDLDGNAWTPIGTDNSPFEGTFDGRGKTISNLKPTVINVYTGLFGYNSGIIRNVYLDKVNVVYTEGYGAAALCSENSISGTIEGCAVLGGKINTSNPDPDTSDKVAGVCAINNGKINKCYNMAAVTSKDYGAGIVYWNISYGTVSNCYNSGEVSGTSDASGEIGGICARNYGKIEYCLNYGEVKNAKTVGGICAANYNGQSSSTSEYSTIKSCYTDSDVCSAEPIGYDGGGKESNVGAKTTAELCEALPSGFGSEWAAGVVDESSINSKLKKVSYTYPSLNGVTQTALTLTGHIYNFGTDTNPEWKSVTVINDADGLKAISENLGGNYVLGGDIDLEDAGWTPIGSEGSPFTGLFSGDGHTIRNFKSSVSEPRLSAGLFGFNSGTIQNVYVDKFEVKTNGKSPAAGLCGVNNASGIIEGCATLGGSVSASNYYGGVGGVAGICANNSGKINRCYNMASVKTGLDGGGVVNANRDGGTVSNCYNAGEVSTEGESGTIIGGISAQNWGKIEFCFNYGNVNNAVTIGGICGLNGISKGTISSCYSDSSVCSAGAVGNDSTKLTNVDTKTTEELCNFVGLSGFDSGIWDKGIYDATSISSAKPRFGKLKVRYTGLVGVGSVDNKFYDVYDFGIGDDYDWQEYTLITTKEQFLAIGKDETKWHENYVLGADLDLTGEDVTPIGNATAFDGKFSGDGHTISGVIVSVSVTGNDPAGLFGGSTGVIMNLAVEGKISGNNAVGGICGQSGGTIYGCSFNGTVTGEGSNVGGICGYNYKNIVNCFSNADVKGSDEVGGICGYNYSGAVVSDTVSVCTVSGSGNLAAAVCGKNDGTLTDNYFDKDVSGITVGAKDGDNNELSDGTIGWTTEELCTIMPGIDDTIWSDGSKITEVDKNNARKHTVTYTYPSLTDIETAYSFEVKEYNFSTGDSPDWQPYTEISTDDDFIAIGNDSSKWSGNYVLTADIDLSGKNVTPIGKEGVGTFTGNFSGDGHTISGVNISSTGKHVGLFGALNGGCTIMNLAVEGNITGNYYVGGICGSITTSDKIFACTFAGSVSGENCVGGICGYNDRGIISDCFNSGTIEGTEYVGGVCGYRISGHVLNCINVGKVSSNNPIVGGENANGIGSCNNNYYDSNVLVGTAGNNIGTPKTTAELCDKDALTTLNLNKSIWQAGGITSVADPDHPTNARMRVANADYLSLIGIGEPLSLGEEKQYNFKTNGGNDDWQEYTEINSADDLAKINDNLGGSYVLMNYITLGDFTTIGSQDAPFTGKFSGNGHKITAKNAGIFGFNEGTIMNLAVEGDITGSGNNVGGICGYNNGTIYACSFKGSVKGKTYVGGISGYNNSTISNCYAIGTVEATEDYAGGICGKNQAGIKIEYCYFAGMPMSAGNNNEAICDGGSQFCYYDRELYYVSDSGLGALTTERLCNSNSLPELFNGDIWETGSFTVTSTDGKFRTVSYKYPRLKEGCEAYKVDDVKQYNFKTDGEDYWARFKEIKTLADLENVNNNTNANYVMMNDIDLDGAAFTPIYNTLYGKFSGDGHTIKNGKIVSTRNYGDYTGLFKDNSGFIMNLAVKCDVSGRIVVGGICGFNYGTIYGCSFEGSVTGNEQVGGICGYMSGSESHIINCYVIGTIKATNTLAGGISGSTRGAENNGYWDFAPPSIKNCYFVGTVTVPDSGKKDAITGKTSADTYQLTVENCYYNSDLYTEDDSKGTGFTTVEMTSSDALSKMTGFDTKTWEKKANTMVDSNGENGVAYYPSLIGSRYVPSVEYTADMKFERTEDTTVTYLEAFQVEYGCEIKFANGAEKQLGSSELKYTVSDSTGNITNLSLTGFNERLFAYAAGEITYTLKFEPQSAEADFLPASGVKKDLVVNIDKMKFVANCFSFMEPSSLVFDGNSKQASVIIDSQINGYGEITVKYFNSSGDVVEPIDVGEYTVKVDAAEGDNCLAVENLTADSWKFEITKAAAPVIPDNSVSTSWIAKNKSIPAAGLPERMGEVSVTAVISGADIIAADSARYSDGEFFFTIGANKESYIGKTADITFTFTTQNYNDFTYTVKVTLTEKGDQSAPDTDDFDLVFINNGTDIMAKIATGLEGVEFSFDGVNWNTEGTSSSNHNTIVTAYIRFAETDELNASPATTKSANSGHGDMVHHERVEPTCTEEGSVEYWECELCGEYFLDENGKTSTTLEDTVLAIVPHNPSEAVRENEVPATCTVDGSYDEVIYCSVCNTELSRDTTTIPSKGHDPEAAVEENRVEATCTVDGSYDEVVYCSVCEEELSRTPRTIPATGHDWATEWSIDEHDHWHKCEICGEIKDKAVHVSSGAATETTPETCTVCGYVIAPELGHIHANHLTEVPAKAATCTEDGNIQYFLCECGKLFTDSAAATETTLADVTIKAEGHKFGDWVTTKEPTYTSTGIKTRTCSVCGAAEEDTIPKKSGGSSGSSSGGGSSRPSTPAETKPTINGAQKSWADISSDVAKLPAGGSATIGMNGETNIPADVIRSIKDSKAKVEFVIDSTRSWIIDGSKITAASAADFSILPGNADRSGLRGTPGANLKISGTGVPADLKLTFRKEFAGQFANVYKLTDGRLQFQGCIKVDENGAAVVSDAYTKGDYVVMVCKFSDRSGDMNNDGVLNALDVAAVLKDIVGIADGENPIMGDYNGDGIVNALDAATILKAIVGIAA